MWNASEHTDDENLRWCWLRAVEWDAWPFFVSQPVVPLLIAGGYVWWELVIGVAAIQVVWTIWVYVTKFVNVWMAGFGVLVASLRWFACPFAAYKLYSRHEVGLAAFAFFWPLVMHVFKLALLVVFGVAFRGVLQRVGQIGALQALFMQKIGYRRTQDEV